jgi:hypothetical protein
MGINELLGTSIGESSSSTSGTSLVNQSSTTLVSQQLTTQGILPRGNSRPSKRKIMVLDSEPDSASSTSSVLGSSTEELQRLPTDESRAASNLTNQEKEERWERLNTYLHSKL